MDFSSFFTALLFRTPLFLLWLVGIVLAVFRFGRHPRVSISVIFGLLIIFVSTLISLIMPTLYGEVIPELSAAQRPVVFALLPWLQRAPLFLDFAGWLLILFGVFADRKSAS